MTLWKTETFHPLVVHFPIALLVVSTFIWFANLLFRKSDSHSRSLRFSVDLLLAVGVITAWAGIYTGNLAEDVVNRVICDPTVSHRHEDFSKIATWLFSAALLIRLVIKFATAKFLSRHFFRYFEMASIILVTLIMCTGTVMLIWSAHLGASLVYLQGAAVYRPTETCEEFE